MITVLPVLIIHALVTYQGVLFVFAKYNSIILFKRFALLMSVAFSTSSIGAIIMDTLLKKFKISEGITSFTIPLGANVNMYRTAIMQEFATVFIA